MRRCRGAQVRHIHLSPDIIMAATRPASKSAAQPVNVTFAALTTPAQLAPSRPQASHPALAPAAPCPLASGGGRHPFHQQVAAAPGEQAGHQAGGHPRRSVQPDRRPGLHGPPHPGELWVVGWLCVEGGGGKSSGVADASERVDVAAADLRSCVHGTGQLVPQDSRQRCRPAAFAAHL